MFHFFTLIIFGILIGIFSVGHRLKKEQKRMAKKEAHHLNALWKDFLDQAVKEEIEKMKKEECEWRGAKF